jgi:carboxylesterase
MTKDPLGVLILHGFTSSLDCVRGIVPPLEAMGLPLRMPVLRGHGADSPEALRQVRWQDWVADGAAALRDLLTEAERAIIVGHSMGTMVTVCVAADHSTDVDSIVLAAATVRMVSPLAPGRPLSFLAPLVKRSLTKWDMPPNYADPSLAAYDTNYPWAPIEAVVQFLKFTQVGSRRLPEIAMPALIMQSRNDSTVAPESAELAYAELGTPPAHKRIVWFEKTGHEMFRDCEREAAVAAVADFVRERVAARGGD